MARKKNLERAIILGLILSTGVYGSAWAAESIESITDNNAEAYQSYSKNNDIIITDGDEGNIVLKHDEHNISIEANEKSDASLSNITLMGNGTGVWLTEEVAAGTKVSLDASGDIIIDAQNGIQGNASARGENNVSTITLNAQNNRITATKTAVYGLGKVDIELTADKDNVIVTTGNDYAVKTDANSAGILNITAQDGNNIIMAEKGTAIRANGNKVITIKANNKDNEENGNNIIIGGENGIQHNEEGKNADGQTIVKDANTKYVIIDGKNNVVYGGENGILSDGTGIVKVTANESNTIGQYSDESNVTHTSNTGINVTEGTVDIDANTGNNVIYAKNIGIDVSKGKADLDAFGNNIINVNSKNLDVSGILVENYGQAEITSANGGIEINVTATKSGPANYKAYAIKAIKNGSVNLDAKGNISIKLNVNDDSLNANQNGKITSALTAEEKSNAKVEADGFLYLESKGNKIGFQGNQEVKNFGIQAEDGSTVDITVNGKNENGYGAVIKTEGRYSTAISSANSLTELKLTNGGLYIDNVAQDNAYSLYNLASVEDSRINISANGDIYLKSTNNSPVETAMNTGAAYVKGIVSESEGDNNANTVITGNNMLIEAVANGENTVGNIAHGIQAANKGTGKNLVDIDVNSLAIIARSNATVGQSNYGIGIDAKNSYVDINAANTSIDADYGIQATSGTNVDINANLYNYINSTVTGVYSGGEKTTVNLTGKNNIINAATGLNAATAGSILLKADTTNHITSTGSGVSSSGRNSNINLEAKNNSVYAGEIVSVSDEFGNFDYYGQKKAINALSGSDVTLTADKTKGMNYLLGAVYASGSAGEGDNIKATKVDLTGNDNVILSNAEITNAGGRTDNVISALYAQDKAIVNVSGTNNIQTYYSDPNDTSTTERVVWAYQGADINITGNTNISTSQYLVSPNNMDIAIVAGTAKELTKADFDETVLRDLDIANVDLKYENNNSANSSITGDILSAYGGVVNIAPNSTNTRAASDAGINITGNLLAGNNGVVDINLGKGGSLIGRADDYSDAEVDGTNHGAGIENGGFFNPAFSSEIIKGGTVNLTMGKGSRWDVTGQSWITSLTTTGNAEDTLISLEKAKEDLNSNASALTIGSLTGNTRFYMNLNGDRSASDMLYIKNAQGIDGGTAHYNIYLQDDVTSAEINSDGTKAFNGLRFATVGTGSNVDFTVKSQGTGSAFDVEYEVDTDSYVNNSENSDYNSTTGGDANVEKPGDDSVNDFFGLSNSGTQEDTTETVANNIVLMAANEEAAENVAANNNTGLDEVTNFKIVARKGEEISDTGKTILNMSRANYSNAIYMDRLNKRLGEARYINSEEDEGMWVRIRHDRIGKDNAYRSQNTMYELGYDQKQECDNGERRVGMAIDYMHGDTGYNDIAGKGEIDRYGLWLYDTWMGDKGHYADYVAKWGHLSNDFEVYTMNDKTKQVTGDYSNNVFSVSAEYGRKKDIGNDWYFEPQVQAQLARVTGADYTTSQGTKVSVDGINSLIGRAGFRLGKDFGEEKQSTVYIKADVLHEFLGDQDVRVLDKSSDNKWAGISYENEGTWYDVGFGFATQMGTNSYAFMDFEKSFGNDNDETYQINVGMQWSF